MTANLSRGWAPLRGVLVGREKYIDLPIQELYDLGGRSGRAAEPGGVGAQSRRRAAATCSSASTSPRRRCQARRRPPSATVCVRSATSAAAPRRRAIATETPTIRSARSTSTSCCIAAATCISAGRLKEAAAAFQQAIDRRADTADAYRYLAFVYWQAGRPRDAIDTLETALKRGVSHRDISVKLGIYLAETGGAARAIALLEGLAGDDTEALNALGIAYGHANRSAEAMRTFRHVLELDPTNGLAWQNIGTLELRAGDRAAAEASLRRALSIDDSLPGAYTTLGVVLSESGRKADAIEMWKNAVALDPTEFDALYNLTLTLLELKRPEEARTYGERYVSRRRRRRSSPPTSPGSAS